MPPLEMNHPLSAAANCLAPSWPLPDDEIKAALLAAYADGSWGQYDGSHCAALCQALSDLVGLPYVTLCASGTVATELALRGLAIGPGDEVALAAYDFPGNFRAIEAVGARPVLVDFAPETWQMDLKELETALGPQTKAVIASHLHGDLLPMPKLCELARARNVAVVEDCCQVPGAIVAGQPAGSWGDVSLFSFGGSKLLTAGRGGAVLTAREDVHQRMRIANDRGNLAFPLSELQAAVVVPQLSKLAARNARRLENVRRLLARQADYTGLQALRIAENAADQPAFYKLPFRVLAITTKAKPANRATWIARLQAAGLAVDSGFRGFAKRSAARCRQVGDLPHARDAAENTLLLHHPVLLENSTTINKVADILSNTAAELSE